LYLRGVPAPIPIWVTILEAAGEDPLRAQQIEMDISQEWWERYLLYRKEKGLAMKEQQRKMEQKQKGKHGRRKT